jgi:hypothetical protein
MGQYIKIPPAEESDGEINSLQNCMLLKAAWRIWLYGSTSAIKFKACGSLTNWQARLVVQTTFTG